MSIVWPKPVQLLLFPYRGFAVDKFPQYRRNSLADATTLESWAGILKETYETLQENFYDAAETYLQQNPEMEIAEDWSWQLSLRRD